VSRGRRTPWDQLNDMIDGLGRALDRASDEAVEVADRFLRERRRRARSW